jgi:site-specific recombinase XerD
MAYERRRWSIFVGIRWTSKRPPFVFTSERGTPFTTAGFARMVERAGTEAKLGFKAHPHMLRHACGYALANRGHDTIKPANQGAARDAAGR